MRHAREELTFPPTNLLFKSIPPFGSTHLGRWFMVALHSFMVLGLPLQLNSKDMSTRSILLNGALIKYVREFVGVYLPSCKLTLK